MGMIIEMLGSPGAGKSTMMTAVADGCRDLHMSVFTVDRASREFARRTTLGRTVLALTPQRHHSRALWGVYRVVSGWHMVSPSH